MMRILLILVLVLLPSSCGSQQVREGAVDYTKHGYALFWDVEDPKLAEVDIEAIEILIDQSIRYFETTTKTPREEILDALYRWEKNHQLYIELVSDSLPCPTEELPQRTCSGLFYHSGLIQVVWRPYRTDLEFCPAITSLTHEYTHYLALRVLEDSDGQHRDTRLFYYPEASSTLAAWYYINRYCPWMFTNK